MKIREIISEHLRVDVPNEKWLQSKIAYSVKQGKNEYGVPYHDATTAYISGNEPVMIPVSILKTLPGMTGEQNNVRSDDLTWLVDHMRETGKLPLVHGKEYAPYVMVMYDGSAWINEGNHRIMAADILGWREMPVELRYFDGGERVESGPLFPAKIGL